MLAFWTLSITTVNLYVYQFWKSKKKSLVYYRSYYCNPQYVPTWHRGIPNFMCGIYGQKLYFSWKITKCTHPNHHKDIIGWDKLNCQMFSFVIHFRAFFFVVGYSQLAIASIYPHIAFEAGDWYLFRKAESLIFTVQNSSRQYRKLCSCHSKGKLLVNKLIFF